MMDSFLQVEYTGKEEKRPKREFPVGSIHDAVSDDDIKDLTNFLSGRF